MKNLATEERRKLIREIRSLAGAENGVGKLEGGDEETKVALLLGKRVEGVDREMMDVAN